MPFNLRRPAVAGSFYPGDKDALKVMMDGFIEPHLDEKVIPGEILGMIVPHAGYIYSGKTTGIAFSRLRSSKVKRFVIIGPNHASFPPYSALYPSGQWNTPLGNVTVDESLGKRIKEHYSGITSDPAAHTHEHSLEVQVPFLQYLLGNDVTITPIIMGRQTQDEAHKVAQALLKMDEQFIVIASSDLNHYENLDITTMKDRLLLDAILRLDVEKFYHVLQENDISACGYAPIAIMMEYTKEKGGKLDLLEHTTSFDYSGDNRNVVGYCSIMSSRQP